MSTTLKLTTLISLPKDFGEEVSVGNSYTIKKSEIRMTPIGMPLELATSDYRYIGKIVVRKLVIEESGTEITFEVIKVFTEEESKVFSENFVRL